MAADGIERVEARTCSWLSEGLDDGIVGSKQDFLFNLATDRPQRMSLYWFQRYQRQLAIFRWLEQMEFESFVDVGSGIEYYPLHARERYGADAYYTDLQPRFLHPFDGEWSGKRDHAVVSNVRRLPFPDGAFDVVVCTEVLEHLVRPVEAIAELQRIARRYLILTSLEAWAPSSWKRRLEKFRTDVRVPHVERNFLSPEEFAALFGTDCHFESLVVPAKMPASPFEPEDVIEKAYGGLTDLEELVAALARAVGVGGGAIDDGGMGVLLVKSLDGSPAAAPDPARDLDLARWILERAAYVERCVAFTMLGLRDGHLKMPNREAPVSAALVARVCCPDCRGGVAVDAARVVCRGCGESFAAEFGVPVLTPTRETDAATAEAIDRLCGTDARRRRVVEALVRRLRRNEEEPGLLRKLAMKMSGSPEG
jgi:SAM-dependent methyltransferase/uncharacterized protein YbaR (Trm112 family)